MPETKSAACTQMVNGANKMFLMKSRKRSLFHFTLILGFIIWMEKKKKLGLVQLVLRNVSVTWNDPSLSFWHGTKKMHSEGTEHTWGENGSPEWLDSLGVVLFFEWRTIKILIRVQKSYSKVKLKVWEFREVRTRGTVGHKKHLIVESREICQPKNCIIWTLGTSTICLFNTFLYLKCSSNIYIHEGGFKSGLIEYTRTTHSNSWLWHVITNKYTNTCC